MMNINIENGKITFDIDDLMRQIPPDKVRGVVEVLSCNEDLIDFVMEQVFGQWTENGYYSSRTVIATEAPTNALDRACRRVAMEAGDVAKSEIKALEKALAYERDRSAKLIEELYSLRQRR